MEERRPTRRWALWAPALALLAGAAGMLLVNVETPDDGTRAKGGEVALRATVEESGGSRTVVSGERVAPGARLQLAYDAGSFTHVGLLGIDPSGAVSAYFPSAAETLAPLPAGPRGNFPFSLTLDATVGDEQFVAVFSEHPLNVRELLDAAKALSSVPTRARPLLKLPKGAAQATLWLEKK